MTSALFHDEPTIDFLNRIGVRASVVGNHEFDEGYEEPQRMQRGGCHPADGCQFRDPYRGAKFPFLGANVTTDRGLPALLPFTVEFANGVPIGIIGVTLKDLPSVLTPEAVKGLKFGDEVQAIDRTADLLDKFGIRTQYNCVIDDPAGAPRPVVQSLSFGRLLSVVDLKVDRRTRDVIRGKQGAQRDRHAHGHTGRGCHGTGRRGTHEVRADRQPQGRHDHRGPGPRPARRPASRRWVT
ncbi:5'-nucleotidase [Kibdelosporangium phytohabitans]|uniref:5'-Nucleotidase C-terminal domain-containing protein n=1 Tax=Kibdelosporangium phytohabitans TaxID=860235 RepID=A0A0N7F2F7_9PSEU|nr:hypothetical protein AOZ06_01065 [Kibdelosporangium phytohabitans]MBE1466310.1 5'-nucleotidase [Kibdelosporangium phytohabitans]